MKDLSTLACWTVPPSGDTGKLIVHFCFFLLFLFHAFQFQYSNEAMLPQMIAFLSRILPCQLMLSISSNVKLHKCRTFPHGFSCSSVVMPHSEFLLNFHCGNRGVLLVWSHRAAKCLVSEEHAPYSYVPLSLARTWRVLEVVINVLLLISDSHTKCACVPAIHPHP